MGIPMNNWQIIGELWLILYIISTPTLLSTANNAGAPSPPSAFELNLDSPTRTTQNNAAGDGLKRLQVWISPDGKLKTTHGPITDTEAMLAQARQGKFVTIQLNAPPELPSGTLTTIGTAVSRSGLGFEVGINHK